MRVYDTLDEPLRRIVDRLVAETGAEDWAGDWEVRRAFLTSVFDALDRGARRFPDAVRPQEALSAIVAGLVERLGEPPIRTRLQAGIYAVSLKPDHRIASAEWFGHHPDEYDAIQRELVKGPASRLN